MDKKDKEIIQYESLDTFAKYNNSNNFDNYYVHIISRLSKILNL